MFFPHGHTVYRLRAASIPDPYNPDEEIAGDWDNPDIEPIPGAFIAQSSTLSLRDATRTQALESKSLFCDPHADVLKDDRIRDGEAGAPIYQVDGIPTADVNPFTGWQPVREIPLERAVD